MGVGVAVSSGRLGRRLLAFSSAVSGVAAGAAFGLDDEGGFTGMIGAVRGNAWVGMFGVRAGAGVASAGGVVAAGVVTGPRGGAGGRCTGATDGRCFTTDSG